MRLLGAWIVAGVTMASTAHAGGSIAFEDLYTRILAGSFEVGPTARLKAAIDRELAAQHLKLDDVQCVGVRFGPQWTELSGERIGPYDCWFGEKRLIIFARKTTFRKKSGVRVVAGDLERQATSFNEGEFDYKWEEQDK